MINIDEFLIKENDRFFVDLEEWVDTDDTCLEDGDIIKFNYEGTRFRGTLRSSGKYEKIFELINIKILSP